MGTLDTGKHNPFLKEEKGLQEPTGNPFLKDENSGKSVEATEVTSGNTNFQDVIDVFNKSNKPEHKELARILESIKTSFKAEQINEVNSILALFSTEKNTSQLVEYIRQLQVLSSAKVDEENGVRDNTREDEERAKSDAGWWNDFENPIAWVEEKLWPSEDLVKIRNISLDGNVENTAAFTIKIEKLKGILPDLLVFKNLSEEDRAEFLKFLDSISSSLLEQEKKNLSYIEDQYNSLAKQIERQDDGGVVLDLGGDIGKISFASKEEAFKFILDTKQTSESELESWSTNASEAIGSLLLKGIYYSLNTFSYPYQQYAGKFEETYEDFMNDEHWTETYAWNGIGIIIGGILTINYTETLWRRIIKDTLGKFGVKRYVFENFDRRQLTFRPDDGGAEKQAEFNNRLDAYRALEELGATKTGKEKLAFDKEMENILDYMRINTSTYWLKVRALREGKWIVGKGIYAFKYGPNFTPYNIVQEEQSIANANNEKFQSDLKKDLTYVFQDPSFDVTENGRILRVNHKGESENIAYLKNYINSRSDISESEKKSRIKRIEDFLNWLETHPRGEKFIKAELISIGKEGQLTVDEVKAKLEEKYPFLKEVSDDGSKKTMSEQWGEIKSAIAKAYGNNTPLPSYTRGHALAFRFLSLVESGQWSGNEAHLNEVFKMIDSGKFEISHIYKFSLINPKRWLDVVTGVIGRYGIQTPELTRLRRVSEGYSSKTLQEMMKTGKDFEENHKKLKDILEKGYDIDGKRYTPIQALENYIKYDIPDAEETRLRPILTDFIKLIQEGKIILSPTELFREIEKLKNGFMPSPVLLEKLNKLREEELKKAAKSVDAEKKSLIDRLKFLDISLAERTEISADARKMFSGNIEYLIGEILKGNEDGINKGLDDIFLLGKYAGKEVIDSITRKALRLIDIRIKLKKAETGEKVGAYETRYDPFIEEAKKGKLNMSEKDFLDLKNGKFEFDATASYIGAGFTKDHGEDFVKSMEEFQDLHKYDLRKSLGIAEGADLGEIEKALNEKYRAEIELAYVYNYMDGRPSTIGNDIKSFAGLIQNNDFTRGQAKSILDLMFIQGKAFGDINTDAIIRRTPDNVSEFDGKDKLRNSVLEKFNGLDDADKKATLEYIRNSSSIDRNNLPPTIQDELKKFEGADEARKTLDIQKAELERISGEIDDGQTAEELDKIKKEFNDYIKDQKINRVSEDFKDLVQDFTGKYNTKKAELATAKPTPEEKAVPKSETVTKSGKLTAGATRVVEATEYMLRANEFSTVSGLVQMTPQVEAQLQELRENGILPNGKMIQDITLDQMRAALKTHFNLDRIPNKVEEAKSIFETAEQPDKNIRIYIEGKILGEPFTGEPRSWKELFQDDRFHYIDDMTDDGRSSLDIIKNSTSPAEALRNAEFNIKSIFRNLR